MTATSYTFSDGLVPSLPAGAYTVHIRQSFDPAASPFTVTQPIDVQAPQFGIDPSWVHALYPPPNSVGRYDAFLPHAALTRTVLPWERSIDPDNPGAGPWLAVLSFGEGELPGDPNALGNTDTMTVQALLSGQEPGVVGPAIQASTVDPDVLQSTCTSITVPIALLPAIAPRAAEVPYLVHCRQATGTADDGQYAFVVGNRFAAAAGGRFVAHLVSLETYAGYLVDQPAFPAGTTAIRLVSLACWSYTSDPDTDPGFAQLAAGLVANQSGQPTTLRLPAPPPPSGAPPAATEAANRLIDGYVPLTYVTRTGEQTFAWYRGPCPPAPAQPLPKAVPHYTSADQALVYVEPYGVFDASYAAAWTFGRAFALGDTFATRLAAFRRSSRALVTTLCQQLATADLTTPGDVAQLIAANPVRAAFDALLTGDAAARLGRMLAPAARPASAPSPAAGPGDDPAPAPAVAAMTALLAQPAVAAAIRDEVADDVVPLAQWLAGLTLLKGVGFEHIVPDPAMLPPESIRFFYVDPGWTAAAIDGALSTAVESSLDTLVAGLLADIVDDAVAAAVLAQRAALVGGAAYPGLTDPAAPITGFLLRSQLVTDWPATVVRAVARGHAAAHVAGRRAGRRRAAVPLPRGPRRGRSDRAAAGAASGRRGGQRRQRLPRPAVGHRPAGLAVRGVAIDPHRLRRDLPPRRDRRPRGAPARRGRPRPRRRHRQRARADDHLDPVATRAPDAHRSGDAALPPVSTTPPTQPALIVPIELHALVVNAETAVADGWQRWTMLYENATGPTGFSIEPKPFQATDPISPGVYLQWVLPEAARHGHHDPVTSVTTFPPVPNRWLVLRTDTGGPSVPLTAWVVQSDYLGDDGTSSYLDPRSTDGPMPTGLGRHVALSEFAETGDPMFLTAVAPGLATFAAYQPYNQDVFSFWDEVGAGTGQSSYLVVGWYSDASGDLLAGAVAVAEHGSFAAAMTDLGWSAGGDDTAVRTVYVGRVNGVVSPAGGIPTPGMPAPDHVNVAVGNTAIDALTALTQQLEPTLDAELLEAFQYGLLDDLARPDGAQLVDQRIHRAWYGAYPGGYGFVLDDGTHPDWLAALNQAQAAYDAAAAELAALQEQLYMVWWLSQYPGYTGDPTLTAALDPNGDGLANVVATKTAALTALRAAVPWGDTPAELTAAIGAYATANGAAPGQLRRHSLPPYYAPNDPVLLLTGLGAPDLLTSASALPCRWPDQLVASVGFQGTTVTAAAITSLVQQLNVANLPADIAPIVTALFAEALLVDPGNAAAVAAAAGLDPTKLDPPPAPIVTAPVELPAFADEWPWVQPWLPLYVLWAVDYYAIDYGDWSFDGSAFVWNGTGAAPEPVTFAGRTFLTPQAQFTFANRLEKYATDNPTSPLAAIEALLATTEGWDVLSQPLDGFTAQLSGRDPTANVSPGGTIGTLVGVGDRFAPIQGGPAPPPWRAGQFTITGLVVVDGFGHAVNVVVPSNELQTHVPQAIAEGLAPAAGKTVKTTAPGRFVQLPPRLLQPARMAFDLVDALTDVDLSTSTATNPVCGWLVVDHLDQSLLVYDPAGRALGQVFLALDDAQQPEVTWLGQGVTGVATIGDFPPALAPLAGVLGAIQAAGAGGFDAFLAAIDQSLWTIGSLDGRLDQSTAVLVGRPLALVRARLRFELSGPPLAPPTAASLVDPAPSAPEFTTYQWPIRLGDGDLLTDGLVGYFGTDNSVFNAVVVPQPTTGPPPASPFVSPIAAQDYPTLPADSSTALYLTMLVDPLAPVHAVTDVVPVATAGVPARFVTGAVGAMDVFFRLDPLLGLTSAMQLRDPTTGAQGMVDTVVMPKPSGRKGLWYWTQPPDWSPMPITAADDRAHLTGLPTLRAGALRLASALAPAPDSDAAPGSGDSTEER